jgi:predicted MFS family arabinose efflux permease
MIPKIVGQEKLANAITLNQATFLTASVSGHAIGGFLIALITIKWTLVVILFLILLASLFFFQIKKQQSEYHKNELQVWASMKANIV